MQFSRPLLLSDLFSDDELHAGRSPLIAGLNVVAKVKDGDLTFADNEGYFQRAKSKRPTAIITTRDLASQVQAGDIAIIICPDPFLRFRQICETFDPYMDADRPGMDIIGIAVDQTALLHPSVSLGPRTIIGAGSIMGPNVSVGCDAQIGGDCRICAGVTIEAGVKIGERVVIGVGSVIGGRPNAYRRKDGSFLSYHAIGNVEIANDVEIGALCSIDRCITDITSIGRGSRIGNGVQIGHGAMIAHDVLIVSHCAIAGDVLIGAGASVYGQAGVAAGVQIGEAVTVYGRTGVTKNVEPGASVMGNYAMEAGKYKWCEATLRNMASQNRATAEGDVSVIPQGVLEVLTDKLGLNSDAISIESRLMLDLGADSLDLQEILVALEDRFAIKFPGSAAFESQAKIMTVGDISAAVGKLSSRP